MGRCCRGVALSLPPCCRMPAGPRGKVLGSHLQVRALLALRKDPESSDLAPLLAGNLRSYLLALLRVTGWDCY